VLLDCGLPNRDGYEVLFDGRWKISIPFWLRVPPNRIVDRIDNPTNRAVVCFTPEAGILCFVRPSESYSAKPCSLSGSMKRLHPTK
jgi:hypothetical protein